MAATRVFVCHCVDKQSQREQQVLSQLQHRLQEIEAETVSYPGDPSDEGFLSFLHQQLPTCQWFILFQTPAAVQRPAIRMAVNIASQLVGLSHLEGILRIIVTSRKEQDIPPEWSPITTFDATADYPRAVEKLLLRLTLDNPPAGEVAPVFPPSPPPGNVAALPLTYDRPPATSSRLVKLKKAVRNSYQDAFYKRKRRVIALTLFLIVVWLGTVLTFLILLGPSLRGNAQTSLASAQVYGHIYFFSTDVAGTEPTKGFVDGVEIYLQDLKPPASKNSYYAWLLPDEHNSNGVALLLGQFTPVNGSAHLSFTSPTQANLLATESRFLITEEATSPMPLSPTADHSKWRYYGEIPQTPNPQDASHLSGLDHLRRILSGTSTTPGGLAFQLFQNARKILEWASAARGVGTPTNPNEIQNELIQILDALDGKNFVNLDVPPDTPILVPSSISSNPILTLNPNGTTPGSLQNIEQHLVGFSNAPHVAKQQQALAGALDVELNAVNVPLEQVRQDARQLATLDDQQLIASTTLPMLDDLVNQATIAFAGQDDPVTGDHQGGITSIFDHLQQLAQFVVTQYPVPA